MRVETLKKRFLLNDKKAQAKITAQISIINYYNAILSSSNPVAI
jgi:hypothetical protein